MTKDRLDRICQMVRSLKEEAGPTMSVGANGYTGAADATGPVSYTHLTLPTNHPV